MCRPLSNGFCRKSVMLLLAALMLACTTSCIYLSESRNSGNDVFIYWYEGGGGAKPGSPGREEGNRGRQGSRPMIPKDVLDYPGRPDAITAL